MEPGSADGVSESAALVALLSAGIRRPAQFADRLEQAGSARAILEQERGLLTAELLAEAAAQIASWNEQAIELLSLLDPGYPENLRAVHDRPPLLFVTGRLEQRDARSVAVIGSRRASLSGRDRARAITGRLLDAGYTIVSGLATGIDTAAHMTALDRGGRTIAVVGTGLQHAYPPENATLQQRIAGAGAVVSQFWPDAGPTRQAFPLRNAVMSGLTLATVVVEAAEKSGARTQIRAALRQGRPVLLADVLLDQAWARDAASRPGVEVIRSLAQLDEVMQRISSIDTLVA